MTKDELKEKLKSAMYAQRILESELDKLQELRSLAQKVTSAYSQAPGGGGNGRALENAVAKIVEQEKVVESCCNELSKQFDEVLALITLLPIGRERTIMHMRYRNYRKWEQIADELGYSEQYMYELHDKALNEITDKITNNNKIAEH